MKLKAGIIFLGAVLIAAPSIFAQQSGYTNDVLTWRQKHQEKLLTDDGWFTVAGLSWLKEGTNTVGSGDGFDVLLTPNFKGGKFGDIEFHGGKAVLHVADGVEATSGGKPVTTIELSDGGEKSKPTVVQTGSQSFFLIEREGKYGIRLKDKNAPGRLNFHGLNWYRVDPAYRVEATLEAYPQPKEVLVPNVLGSTFKYKSPGLLHFKLNGKEFFATRPVRAKPTVRDASFMPICRLTER